MKYLESITVVIMMLLGCNEVYGQSDSLYKIHIASANKYYDAKDYKSSTKEYTLAFAALGNKGYPNDRYNAACTWSLAGNADSAFHNLFIIAEKTGYSNYSHFSTDTDLTPIHNDKRWAEVSAIILANKEKEEEKLNKPLVRILDSIYSSDQQYRLRAKDVEQKHGRDSKEMSNLWQTIMYHDSVNLVKVKAILDEYGWLGPDVIGSQGNTTLFLVIQHADIETQQKYLPMMREAVKNKKARASSLALLEDRTALRTGRKQIYGSQIERAEDGSYHVSALEDPENVDKRRAEVGLQPLNEYTQKWNFEWDVEAHKKYINAKENNAKKK